MRHLFALLTTLSMLQLTLVGGDVACASHSKMDAVPTTGMVMGATPSGQDAAAAVPGTTAVDTGQTSARPTPDCSVPTSERCCAAMSSCSVAGTVSSSEKLAGQSTPTSSTPQVLHARLVSVRSAPEPPPPKA